MKIIVTSLFALSLLTLPLSAEEKEQTITGDGQCAKCSLKQADSCQNAIKVKKDGKDIVYLLEPNDVSKAFHSKICTKTEKVTATGKVKEEGGKMKMTASKIELAAK